MTPIAPLALALSLALALLLAPSPARADELPISSTGRILRAVPPPADRALPAQTPPADPWTFRGQWTDLQLQATMLSRSGAAAVLTAYDGSAHTVHLGSRLGAEGAAVRAISAGRVELVWQTGAPEPERSWCLLVIERVAVQPPPPQEPPSVRRGRREPPPPPPAPTWQTRHRQAACGPTSDVVDPEL